MYTQTVDDFTSGNICLDLSLLLRYNPNMIDALPDSCSITAITGLEDLPETAGPAFTTIFTDAQLKVTAEDFLHCDAARLDIEDGDRTGRSRIRFKAIEHFCEHCGHPNIWEVTYESGAKAIDAFSDYLELHQHFVWILSTPVFEARAVVDRSTGMITHKQLTYRNIH